MRSVVLTSFIIGSLRRSSHCMAFSRGGGGVLVPHNKNVFSVDNCNFAALNTKRSMSFDANEPPPITQIGKDQVIITTSFILYSNHSLDGKTSKLLTLENCDIHPLFIFCRL